MLNFLTNFFQEKASARSVCGDYQNNGHVIQACAGCDSECQFTCYVACASECQGNSQGSGGVGGSCNSHCTGTCFSVASILGTK